MSEMKLIPTPMVTVSGRKTQGTFKVDFISVPGIILPEETWQDTAARLTEEFHAYVKENNLNEAVQVVKQTFPDKETSEYGNCHCGAKKVKNPKTNKVFCSDKCWLKE